MNKNNRTYNDFVVNAITLTTANRYFAENLKDLSALLESIAALEGAKAQVSKLFITFRIVSKSNFAITPLIVQTAGTFADTVDSELKIIDKLLDAAIDDVFGYQRLQPMKVARKVPVNDNAVDTEANFALQFSLEIPSNVLQILNKESETERLQNIYLGLIGHARTLEPIDCVTYWNIDYKTVSKKIILR